MSCDTRYMSRDFITEFINIYRSNPCLWQVKCKDYLNKNLKNNAYEKLVEFCRRTVPDANREFVTKKIQNLRAAFRKEMRKVESSRRSGASSKDVYEPTLWYYELLTFTSDVEHVIESVDNITDYEILQNMTDEESNSNIESKVIDESQDPQLVNSEEFQRPPTVIPKKTLRRKRKNEQGINKFMSVCTDALKFGRVDEYEAVGLNVAAKLRRMDSKQAIFAEYLISQVLCKGLLNQLTEDTSLTKEETPMNLMQYVQSPLSSTSSIDDYHEFME